MSNSIINLAGFTRGQRVQLHPATDRWMMGDKFGVVTGLGPGWVRVKLDVSGKSLRLCNSNVLVPNEKLAAPAGRDPAVQVSYAMEAALAAQAYRTAEEALESLGYPSSGNIDEINAARQTLSATRTQLDAALAFLKPSKDPS